MKDGRKLRRDYHCDVFAPPMSILIYWKLVKPDEVGHVMRVGSSMEEVNFMSKMPNDRNRRMEDVLRRVGIPGRPPADGDERRPAEDDRSLPDWKEPLRPETGQNRPSTRKRKGFLDTL